MDITDIVLSAGAGIAALGFVGSAIVITEQNTVKLIERFGKYVRTAEAGLSFRIPLIEQVAHQVSLQVTELAVEADVKTSNNVFVKVPLKIQIKVVDAIESVYARDEPEEQIASFVLNEVRSFCSGKDFDELYSLRDAISDYVRDKLSVVLGDFGYELKTILVDQPIPPADVRDAFNSVVAEDKRKEAAVRTAEAHYISVVRKAEAEKEAKRLGGEGIAAQRKAIVDGLKESMESLTASTGGSVDTTEILATLLVVNQADVTRDVAEHKNLILMSGSGSSALEELGRMKAALKSLEVKK